MGENGKKTCFVVQGFGIKTDHRTGRNLNLDDSYEIIKEAVEDAGLECIRADEIPHSGSIDQVMYEQLMEADVVVADISTSNWNAAYELGVRHALRPRTTLIVAETEFPFEFDINHTAIMTYKHGGDELGRSEAKRFHKELKGWIEGVMDNPDPDSPVYTFLKDLKPPEPGANGQTATSPAVAAEVPAAAPAEAPVAEAEDAVPDVSLRELKLQALQAKGEDMAKARDLFADARDRSPKSEYVYLTQQLALATYKAKEPDEGTALNKAKEILAELEPRATNDPETLGLWSGIHKRMWQVWGKREDLDSAIWANEKGFYLKDDYYNGINLAYLLSVRAALDDRDVYERIADFVRARQVREEVAGIVGEIVATHSGEAPDPDETEAERLKRLENVYWELATGWEAYFGLGNDEEAAKYQKLAEDLPPPQGWMLDSTQEQLGGLKQYLDKSPIAEVTAAGTTDNGEAAAALAAAQQEAADAKTALTAAQQALTAAQAEAAAGGNGSADLTAALASAQQEAAEAKAALAAAQAAPAGNGELSGALEAAKQEAAAANAALVAAQQAKAEAEARATAAEAQRAASASAAMESGAPLAPADGPAAVVAVSDPDEAERVQFALVAPGVQFQVSGIDVEVTVKGGRSGA